jgi:hypothetical protein
MEDLRYPIGKYVPEENLTPERREEMIAAIEATPARLRDAVAGLSDAQLETPYRPGGWTVRQLVHHVADSHMNSFVRFKLALTEDGPTIRPYDENLWAALPDGNAPPPDVSLALLDALHARWSVLLRAMSPEDFSRPLVHPERGTLTIETLLGIYAWHGPHHTAHVTALREREGW